MPKNTDDTDTVVLKRDSLSSVQSAKSIKNGNAIDIYLPALKRFDAAYDISI